MTLPLMPAWVGRRSGSRFAGTILLVLLALGAAGATGRAQDADPYSATVKVDATADTVVKAREMARVDGQRRALADVIQHLAGNGTAVKIPKLDDAAITDLVTSFRVANERMSAVRYVADYTFHFRPTEVQRLLQNAGISVAGSTPPGGQPGQPSQVAQPGQPAQPVVVIPIYQADGQATLWDDPNPWRDAWDQQPPASGAVRLVVPLGDVGDIATIDAGKALTGDTGALTAIARRNGGGDAVVALAAVQGPPASPTGLDVTVRDYRAGQLVATHRAPLTANPGESGSDLLRRAVAAIVSDIEGGWQNEEVAKYDQEGSLTAVLPITSLDDWLRARARLAAVPAIRRLSLVALSRQEATIEIGYAGSIDQLKTALAQNSLDLVRGDPLWRLARTAPGPAP